ncbi:zinc finger, CCHC-type containing protein [Tanacetum coccineum]|uniref:Zinc finger, CCHC-type containing protein n=1 Tax=Tanacetum coccineum TaxID=301880 RepID=A0ABQ5ISY0_9ASTR
MTDSIPVMKQYNEPLGILERFTQHKMNMVEAIQVSSIIDKLSHSRKNFKHTLKHNKEELTLVDLGSHLRIEESLRKTFVSSSILINCGYKQVTESDKFVLSEHAFMSTIKLNDSIIWHARLGHVHFKRMQDMSKDGLISAFDMATEKTDRGGEYMDTLYFQSVGIIHETTAPYTPQQNGISERKNRVLKEMVNSMLSYSGLSQGFWGEAMLTACYLLNRVPNKRNKITPYELWTKRKPNLNYLRVWGCRAVVRLPDLKLKTLGERGIECIFVGYAEHSKAFRFYVIEPNDSVSINSIIESRDAIFDENRFSSVPRPSQRSIFICELTAKLHSGALQCVPAVRHQNHSDAAPSDSYRSLLLLRQEAISFG